MPVEDEVFALKLLRLPKLLRKAPSVRQMERPQMIGYDMRTLRKQIDLLHEVEPILYKLSVKELHVFNESFCTHICRKWR